MINKILRKLKIIPNNKKIGLCDRCVFPDILQKYHNKWLCIVCINDRQFWNTFTKMRQQ